MVVLYLEALLAIVLSLAVQMAIAWTVQQRAGNSGGVDTIWTFSVGLSGAGSVLWPVGGSAPNARQRLVAALVAICGERYRDYQSRSSAFFPLPPHNGVVT
jgi:steroid 5-alpha reductase family enzyme